MIFQKPSSEIALEKNFSKEIIDNDKIEKDDNVDTVVGPSVSVEGDFASAGNIVVKGSVSGNVSTSKHLLVEEGAKILANIQSGSATISGIVKGNVRVKDTLILTSTAKVIGDIKVKILQVDVGAIMQGKVMMDVPAGLNEKLASGRATFKKREEKKDEQI
jgi:cytoskeletal protein CcmA (bactofilin family)